MTFVYCNVAYANLYQQPSYRSAIDSQALLWEKLELLEKGAQFSRVICEDGYEGWLSNHQINETTINASQFEMITVSQCNVFDQDDEQSLVIREAVAGCQVPVVNKTSDWSQIILPDNKTGWIKNIAFAQIHGEKRKNLIELSKNFLGVPYFWGGKSAKGLDCSGYVQLLHKMIGISIRRDSPMQFEDAMPVSTDPLKGGPGDLLFFAEKGDRITHVGLKLADQKLIHARGMIRINSLEKGKPDFDQTLLDHFVAVKTFL
ncbi:MAG: C40 family peptidase [Calditrichaeota bacterium]|nr:C40 family peptidase [Calditrichota bacterium]